MRKHPSRIFAAVTAAGLVASLGACQVKPGEYRVYKVTYVGKVAQADCNIDVDPLDRNTFFTAESFYLFASDPDNYFLEYNGTTMLGERSGKDYSFYGETIDGNDDIDGIVTTSTHTVKVNLTLTGYQVVGDVTDFLSNVCSGNCDGVPTGQCTTTWEFQGTEIKDVELEHGV
jgi:hypothetical protein